MLISVLLMVGCGEPSGKNMSMGFSPDAVLANSISISPAKDLEYCVTRTFHDWDVFPPRVYHEKLWLNSNNDYCIECLNIFEEINGDLIPCPSSEVKKYNQQLTQGKGYFAVFERGFQIRDAKLFLENYNFLILNLNEEFLGRKSMVVRITSKYLDRPNYTVWIDHKTKLILKYIEDTISVDPLTMMEITELDFNPLFSGIQFHPTNIQKQTIKPSEIEQMGFQTYVPMFVPEGFSFQPKNIYKMKLGESPWCDGRIVMGSKRS